MEGLPIEKIMLELSEVYAVNRYYNFFFTDHIHSIPGISI
jgi:hypothetical protein